MRAMDEYELELRGVIERGLAELPGVTGYSRAESRTSTLLVTVDGFTPIEVEARLRDSGLIAQAGHFYAIEPCTDLGLGAEGGVRFGLAPYNTLAEAERLVAAMREIVGA